MCDRYFMPYKLTREKAKIVCEWFHKAYPDYYTNQNVEEVEVLLLHDIEQSIIDNEKYFASQDLIQKNLLLD